MHLLSTRFIHRSNGASSVWTLRLAICLLSCSIVWLPPGHAQETKPSDKSVELLGTISDKRISESSGLAMSALNPDAFWTINDSGHPSELFLVSLPGKTLLHCNLKDTRNVDWEAMASFQMDSTDWLLIADVGDNSFNRSSCQLHLFEEPKLSEVAADSPKKSKKKRKKKKKNASQEVELRPKTIDFHFDDGSHNFEAMSVDTLSKTVWLVEKVFSDDPRNTLPGIYVLPMDSEAKETPFVAKRIADYPIRNVTGMSFSPDGRRLIIRNYLNAHIYDRAEDQTWEQTVKNSRPRPVLLPLQSQGEAICFTPDSKSVLITSEFGRSTIWKVAIPAAE